MALPMLVTGSDCGPSNPLQVLSKRFDHDRGVQQDHFNSGRASSLREAFRTQSPSTSSFDQDAAAFFSANATSTPQLTAHHAFDLSTLNASLPPHATIQAPQVRQQNAVAAWASDFLQRQAPEINLKSEMHPQLDAGMKQHQPTGSVQWNAVLPGYRTRPMQGLLHAILFQTQTPRLHADQSTWDKEFQTQEKSLIISAPDEPHNRQQTPYDGDELARTAGLLVESVKNEQNIKFRNSEFLGLMEQLRDRTVVVEGNQMVHTGGASTTKWSNDIQSDIKGKGRVVGPPPNATEQFDLTPTYRDLTQALSQTAIDPSSSMQKSDIQRTDPNEAYFLEENEEYARYWNENPTEADLAYVAPTEWGHLQEDWDRFEATSSGIKAIVDYQFQLNNPYLLGDSSGTRHHSTHLNGQQIFHESVLALEAVVQRHPTAGAWFELGVKQQENEREQKAIQALERAVELDPTHLPSWLALATSYTNDCNRDGAYHAIKQWVDRNVKLEGAIQLFSTQEPLSSTASSKERFDRLIRCLITMAQGNPSGEIDPDIQIALAVLLNTNEDYDKAQDCFRTALAVRPDDWLLYNRVGATLANSGHAEDAIQYYYRALELNPVYIRARFNLGISCINLRRYEEAGQHILDALVLQDGDSAKDSGGVNDKRGVVSSALWDSLKSTCLYMHRSDLAAMCDQRDLDGFRSAFQQ